MIYTSKYSSPLGELLLAEKENKLIGLWLKNQNYYGEIIKDEEIIEANNREILLKTKSWLDRYFKKEKPSVKELEINLIGTPFRKKVWTLLLNIPYGKLITYKDLANEYEKKNKSKTSARAIGTAVKHNPISIIIPCHRVVGKNNTLTGYAGGIENKRILLEHEKEGEEDEEKKM